MKPIIEVNQIYKEYNKGVDRSYKSLRDTLSNIPDILFKKNTEKFWALQNIDFKVNAGESIGIIGRNGAGKSTLLKILSRITLPTKGEIILRGRVASLLEVGTGFHPELTGRENVFFNGSILGMKNQEIKSKFEEIVDFSGVESFIDTPLKHYSSGMQMRLAFSVAAHLDAEILLIDEVLAVGDAEFQKKCIGKMEDVSKINGKTIIFVTHQIKALKELTKSCIILNNGIQELNTDTQTCIDIYNNNIFKTEQVLHPFIKQVIVDTKSNNISILIKYDFGSTKMFPHIGFMVYTIDKFPLFGSNPSLEGLSKSNLVANNGTLVISVNKPILNNGKYILGIWFGDGIKPDFYINDNCLIFEVNNSINLSNAFGFIKPECDFSYSNSN